jgi:hypothetical protein
MKKLFYLFLVFFTSLNLQAQKPNITNFSPTSGVVGTSVTITGTNFNATASQNVVFFGATKAAITAASTTSLTVTVPAGATFQPISVLNLATVLTGFSSIPFRVTYVGGSISIDSFEDGLDFAAGTLALFIASGDLDGDGKPDLVTANFNANTISVLRNTSTLGIIDATSLAAKVDISTATNPRSIAIGDIDGDGKLDLAVANFGSSSVSVFRNTSSSGSITFAAKVDFTTGLSPRGVNMGDIDGDGKPDLAIAVRSNPSPTAPTITASGATTFCNGGSVTLNSNVGNNNALNFVRTSSQYVSVPHSASINLGATFTMEAWVDYSGQDITIIDKGNYDFLWSLNPNTNLSKMGFYTRGKGAWVYSTGTVPQNTWTHVAITLNAGRLTFYINGVASGTASVATASQDTQPMNIGRQQPTFCACNHFNGTMDELRIWNLARTPSQIQAYLNSVPTNSTGLVAYYKFDEATGNTTSNATSYGNNGTFVNSPTRQIPSTVPSNVVNALWTPSNTTAPSITASTFGTHTATVTNGFGCTNSASVVTSSLSPMPTAQANAYISTGASITLTASGCSGGTGTYTLKWYKPSDNSLITMPVSPAITTNYYAKCEQALNSVICLSPASTNVTVNVGNYINSIISGNWESINTWTPSRVPLPTDIVIINNHTVTITSNAANAKSLEYKSGATLRYLNAAAKLNVGF